MIATQSASLALLPTGSSMPVAVEALTNAIASEVRLLEDLIGVMRKQRSSVSTDDLQGVDDSVFATHRILVTLGEARRQRRSLSRLIAGTEDLALRTLDDFLGDRMTAPLRDARDGLRAAALILSREVEMNRHVLRSALSMGGEMMRGFYTAGDTANTYTPEQRPIEGEAAGGILIDRRV